MPGARQPLYPPYVIGQNYRILNMQLPEYNLLVQYIGADPEHPNFHQFQVVNGEEGYITIYGSSTYNPNPPAPTDLYVTGVRNAGGRRKSRSRKSKRKTRRAHRKSRRHH